MMEFNLNRPKEGKRMKITIYDKDGSLKHANGYENISLSPSRSLSPEAWR